MIIFKRTYLLFSFLTAFSIAVYCNTDSSISTFSHLDKSEDCSEIEALTEGCEYFDTYNTGCFIPCQANSDWGYWPGTTNDAQISSFAYTGNRSLKLERTTIDPDVLRKLGNQTSGTWRLDWKMYVPSGKNAYYNIQNQEAGNSWAYDVDFFPNGQGEVSNGADFTFTYPNNQWFSVAQVISVEYDYVHLFINDSYVGSWDYSAGDNNLLQLGAVNFYANDNNLYYVDDFCVTKAPEICLCPTVIDPVCIPGTDLIFDNGCLASSCALVPEDVLVSCNSNSTCDDFDNYSENTTTPISPFWTNFSANSNPAIITSEYTTSGANSMRFDYFSGNVGSDVLFNLQNGFNSRYRFDCNMFFNEATSGGMGLLYDVPSNAWAFNCAFNTNNTGEIRLGTSNTSFAEFTYPSLSWFPVAMIFDIGTNTIEVWVNNNFVAEWDFDAGEFNNQYAMDAMNMWITNGSHFYVDDICFSPVDCSLILCTGDYEPVCVNGTVYQNPCIANYCYGYTENEWTEGECDNIGCNDCTDCFFYTPTEEPSTINFYNNYCYGDATVALSQTQLNPYIWEVRNSFGQLITPTYTEGTNETSANPVIVFPNTGTYYDVCQYALYGDGYIEICCLTIYVPSTLCNEPPVCHLTPTLTSGGIFTLSGIDTEGANSYSWDYPSNVTPLSSSDGQTFQCQIPGGSCETVCLTATNECGFSSYCTKICWQAAEVGCTSYTNIPDINPQISGSTVEFNGVPTCCGWTYDWSYTGGEIINGSQDGSNPIFEYPENGNYFICLTLTDESSCEKSCICWTIPIGEETCDQTPCASCTDANCTDIQYTFTGNQNSNNLSYSFNIDNGVNPEDEFCRWEIYTGLNTTGEPLSTSEGLNYGYTFGSSGFYTICYYYYDASNGELRRCCRTINIDNPFNCGNESIVYNVTGNNSQFTFSDPNFTDYTWQDDDTGAAIGTGVNSNVLPLPSNCTLKNVSVRYRDVSTGCWYICCIQVYLCPPVNCEDNVVYNWNFAQNNYSFGLNSSNVDASSIVWQNDNTGQTFGQGQTNPIYPFGTTCTAQSISVRYRDLNTGCWYICCRVVYLCPPQNCSNTDYAYVNNTIQVSLTATNVEAGSISWFNDTDGTVISTGSNPYTVLPYPTLPTNCGQKWISVRYKDSNTGCWYICCRLIYFCNPTTCGNANITINQSDGNSANLSVPSNLEQVTWTVNGTASGSGNSINTNFTPGQSYTICSYYLDASTGCWYVCCRTYNPNNCTLPTANFTHSVNNLAVSFTNLSMSPEGGATYLWDYGDNSTSTAFAAPHTYATPGFYTVCLTVMDDCGSNTYCQEVGVNLIFDIDDNICGGQWTDIAVPVRVRNFKKVTSFEYTIQLTNSSVANLISVSNFNSNLGAGFFGLVNDNTLTLSWSDPQTIGKDLNDNEIAFYINLSLIGSIGEISEILINGNVTDINGSIFNTNTNSIDFVPIQGIAGSVCIQNSNFDITGNIHRINNDGSSTPVSLVDVNLSGDASSTLTTNATGNYSFSALSAGGDFVITPEKDINIKNGVNGVDIIKIRRDILGIEAFSNPYQHIAADVDNSGSVNGVDIVRLRRVILNIDNEFPNNESWRFVDKDYNFINPNEPLNEDFPEIKEYSPLSSSQANQDFVAVKVGDVDNSGSPTMLIEGEVNDFMGANNSMLEETIILNAAQITGTVGETVTVAISSEGFNNLIVLEHSLVWDENIIELQGTPYGFHPELAGNLVSANFGMTNVDSGILSVAWQDLTLAGITVPSDEAVYLLDFLIVGEVDECSFIEFTEEPTAITITDVDFNDFTVTSNSGSVKVIENTPELSATTSITNLTCFQSNDGTITVNTTGGSGDWSYQWSNSENTPTIENLIAGSYAVTVTDNQTGELINLSNIGVTQPNQIALNFTLDQEDSGSGDGKATVNVSGNNGPFTYLWNDAAGQTTAQACNLPASSYTVVVTDANGCEETITVSVTLEQLAPLSLNIEFVDIICVGEATGMLTANVTGGSEGYSYLWSNGSTSQSIQNLAFGDYSVTVTDNETGNTIEGEESIFYVNDALDLTTTASDATNGQSNGSASVSVTGGDAPYTYLWNDAAGQTSAMAADLAPGEYDVTVTDNSDCTEVAEVTVDSSVGLDEIDISEEVEIRPNPTSNYLTIDIPADLLSNETTFSIYSIAGALIKEIDTANLSNSNELKVNFDLMNGVYLFHIKNGESFAYKRFVVQK